MSKEILFQIPGQGSHFLGMGRDLWDSGDKFFRELLQIGSDTISLDLPKVIFGEDVQQFNFAKILQPALSAISLAWTKILAENGIKPTTVMGHSLGEITALGVVGSLSPQDTVEMSAYRGILMDNCAKTCGGGGMTAVLMGDAKECQEIIDNLEISSDVFVANDNAPTQAVISGKLENLSKFEKYLTENTRMKPKRIEVVGPWHTPFIQHAKDEFSEWVKNKNIVAPKCKFIMNTTANEVHDPAEIRKHLADKFVLPVRWRESCEYVKDRELAALLEVGPGKVLAGLMRANKIIKSADFHLSVSSMEGVQMAVEKMESAAQTN